MFPLDKYTWPGSEGLFGAVRKFDIHTGIDLYCESGSKVYAVGPGKVISVEDFTGPLVGSPWWHPTQSVLVEGMSGVICYGEIDCLVDVGQTIREGDVLGKVKTVLKKDKGKPMTMLHFELYKHGVMKSIMWKLGEQKPDILLNPTKLLKKLRASSSVVRA